MKTSDVKQLRHNKIIVVISSDEIPRAYVNLKAACESLEISYSTISKIFQNEDFYTLKNGTKIYRLEFESKE